MKFLEKLGISEPEASVIFEKKVVKFIKDDNKWIVIARSAAIDEFDVVQKDLSVSLYMTDGKLILLQDKRNYREYYGDCYLKRYKEFASDIVEIIIIPDNQTAREKGYYKESPYGEMSSYDYYQVILIDSSGRELWLNADLGDNDIITEQKDAMAYIKRCGFFCMPGREDKLSQKMEDLIKNKSNQEPKISFLQV